MMWQEFVKHTKGVIFKSGQSRWNAMLKRYSMSYSKLVRVCLPTKGITKVLCNVAGVVNHTEAEFKRLQRRRDAIGREGDARLRNVRALGELAKFRVVPFGSVLSRLKVLYCALGSRALTSVRYHRQPATTMSLQVIYICLILMIGYGPLHEESSIYRNSVQWSITVP